MVTLQRITRTRGPAGTPLYLCPCGVILHRADAPHTNDCPHANTPPNPSDNPEQVTITIEQMHLDIAITNANPATPYYADPGDQPPGIGNWQTIEIGTDGIGGVGYYYTTPGTHHVRVAREDGTVLLEQDVNAQP